MANEIGCYLRPSVARALLRYSQARRAHHRAYRAWVAAVMGDDPAAVHFAGVDLRAARDALNQAEIDAHSSDPMELLSALLRVS